VATTNKSCVGLVSAEQVVFGVKTATKPENGARLLFLLIGTIILKGMFTSNMFYGFIL